ncbi:MAG: hypothetical protein ABIQ12_09820 [Opitutaceae bacterium]
MSRSPSRLWPLGCAALLALVLAIGWLGRPARRPPAEPEPLAAALARAEPRERAIAFGRELERLLARDPQAAAAALRRAPRGPEFTQGLYAVLDALAPRDPAASLALAAELAQNREELAGYSVLFDRFAREDPRAAAERLALAPAGAARENAVRAIASVWSRAEPDAALAWAERLPDAALRSAAVETILADLAERDPRSAIELARRSLRPPALERTLFRALENLTATEPGAAAPLVTLLPPGELQTMAAAGVARALAEGDVPAALAWVQTLPVDLTRRTALHGVLTSWVRRDPAAAARHVLDLPPGPELELAAGHLAPFLATNPAAAIRWADALPDPAARAAAQAQIASNWAQREPIKAVHWAASLPADPLRPDALGGAFSHWLLQDAAAARAWLESASLSAAAKARLLPH